MKLTDTLYEKFTPRERLALFYEAMARKDYAEADRLADTCERKSYKMQDAAYLQNLQYIHVSCLHALLAISEAESRAAAAAALALIAKTDDPMRPRDDAMRGYVSALREILGIWEAWREFCAIAGVNPESVMRTCWGGLPRMIGERPPSELTKTIAADPEAKAGMLELFMNRWQTLQVQNAA